MRLIVEDGRGVDDSILTAARITFITPDGDDKDTDTGVAVSVKTRFRGSFDRRIAFRNRFAADTTFEDPSEHTFDLGVVGRVKLDDINGVITTIEITTVGNDTWKFGYKLALVFSDGTELEQANSGIVLNQDNRIATFNQ